MKSKKMKLAKAYIDGVYSGGADTARLIKSIIEERECYDDLSEQLISSILSVCDAAIKFNEYRNGENSNAL